MKAFWTTLGFCLLWTLCPAQDVGRWITRQALPTASQEMPHAVINGQVYLPGGLLDTGGATTKVDVFDPATNTWTQLAPLPFPMHHLGAVVVRGTLYIIGGYQGNTFSPTSRVLAYEPVAEQWITRAPMPQAQGAHVAVAFGDQIFVFGGVAGGVVQSSTFRYDTGANIWTEQAPMSLRREHLAAAVVDSLIYVVGGRTATGANTDIIEAYSPATDTWRRRMAMPTARGGLTAAGMHGKLYVFGGEAFNIPLPGVFEEVEEYDPATDTWRTMAPMPNPRHGLGAAAVGDTLFLIGGGPVAGFGVTNVNAGFIPPAPQTTATAPAETLPPGTVLHATYPNPFATQTTLSFTLADPEVVHVAVYDLMGRVVATVLTGRRNAGLHHVPWYPRALPAGVYVVRLQAGGGGHTRRLVHMP